MVHHKLHMHLESIKTVYKETTELQLKLTISLTAASRGVVFLKSQLPKIHAVAKNIVDLKYIYIYIYIYIYLKYIYI